MSLNDLPVELLALILIELGLNDLLRCSLLCKKINKLIENDPALQYIIELTVAGYVANKTVIANKSARQLLNEFAEKNSIRKDTLVDLNYNDEGVVNLPNEVINWKYAGGISAWLYYEDMYADNALLSRNRRVDIFTEKFLTSKKPTWSWQSDRLNYQFGILPDADLLVAISRVEGTNTAHDVELHLFSMTTGTSHPDAKTPFINISESAPLGQSIQIVGDVLLLSAIEEVNDDDRHIIVYIIDWKEGVITHKMMFSSPFVRCRICLVTSDTFLLGDPTHGHHNMTSSSVTCATIKVYSCKMTKRIKREIAEFDSPPRRPKLVRSFALPDIHRNRSRLNAFNFIFSPIVDRISMSSLLSTETPYAPPADIQLIAIILNYTVDETNSFNYVFFTPVTTFLDSESLLCMTKMIDGDFVFLIPWESWGPNKTRCMHTGRMSANTHGWRIALEDRILDFNQLDIARDRILAENGYQEYLDGLVTKSTIIPADRLFVSNVTTSLPYRENAFRKKLVPTVGPIYFDDQELLILRDTRGYISMHVVSIS